MISQASKHGSVFSKKSNKPSLHGSNFDKQSIKSSHKGSNYPGDQMSFKSYASSSIRTTTTTKERLADIEK